MTTTRRYYHRTSRQHAERILADGFQDLSETYQTDCDWRGTWFSDTGNAAPPGLGEVTVEVEISEEFAERYFWNDDQGYREYLIPAAILNSCQPFRIVVDD